ncbi:OmpA family protein [uncultured Rhodospira sp.]|uniref:OmpA family protein n=1 Tax=uncultured Rhodospira sp. TaxID=1936189 RepID=UPI0026373FA9|nr:OmpA family protein [uncultured Rhodospira sp.]
MRLKRPAIQPRSRHAASACAGVLLAAAIGAPVQAQAQAQTSSPSVVVNPAFAGPQAPAVGSTGVPGYGGAYGANQPPAGAEPPPVGAPLQLPPRGMPRSRLTLPPGVPEPIISAPAARDPAPLVRRPATAARPEPAPEPTREPTPEPTPDPAPQAAAKPSPPPAPRAPEPAEAPPPPPVPETVATTPPEPEPRPEPEPEPAPQSAEAPPEPESEPTPGPVDITPADSGPPPPASVTMTKPEAPPRSVVRAPGAEPVRTRLMAGTTRLTSDASGRVGPAPPPLAVTGSPMTRPPASPPPAPTAPAAPPPDTAEPPEPPPAEPATAQLPESVGDPTDDEPAADTAPPQQTASRPAEPARTGAVTPAGGTVSLLFDGDRTDLPDSARPTLDRVVAVLDGNPAARATVRAYADGGGDANQARRTSLSRALSVRAYLIDQGVASARIDVRALGDQAGDNRKDRVDVVTAER